MHFSGLAFSLCTNCRAANISRKPFFRNMCFVLTLIFTKLFLFSGCKIKALRAKTNTYIKTPVRGEEPVFVVTGRKEDVALAKREILSAADHFSQIRASRKSNINSTLAFGQLMANTPGQTTVQVRVPYRVVGLVVGPKGATIKRIQQQVCFFFFLAFKKLFKIQRPSMQRLIRLLTRLSIRKSLYLVVSDYRL